MQQRRMAWVGIALLVAAPTGCGDDDGPSAFDAGVSDAALDASLDAVADAPTDGGIDAFIPLDRVVLASPPNGALTGSTRSLGGSNDARRPRLSWTAVPNARWYDIALDDSCEIATLASCTFPSPEVETRFGAERSNFREGLPVPSVAPRVARYAWRVRACAASFCGEWSVPRYFTVGALRGDYDGDGYEDLTLGVRGANDAAAGEVRVVDEVFTDPPPTLVVPAPSGVTRFGSVVEPAGDLDGDHYADLLVAGGPAAGLGRSRVFVYFGSATGLDLGSRLELNAPSTAAGFGAAIAAVGDLDLDGLNDFVVGAPGEGLVYFFAGSATRASIATHATTSAPPGIVAGSAFGAALARVGDLDRDGAFDFLVGAPTHDTHGAAFIARGGSRTFEWVQVAAPSLPADARFGASVAGGGDLRGDGRTDVVVGAPGEGGGAGAAYVFETAETLTAAPTVTRLAMDMADPTAGYATAVAMPRGWSTPLAGDLTGEVLVTAPNATSEGGAGSGNVYSYLARADTGIRPEITFPAFHPDYVAGAHFGGGLGLGDFNGDGLEDMAVGAPREVEGSEAGEIFIGYGGDGAFGLSIFYQFTYVGSGGGAPRDFGAVIGRGGLL